MRALNLDFSGSESRWQQAGKLFLLLSVLGAAVCAWSYVNVQNERATWAAKHSDLTRKQRAEMGRARASEENSPEFLAEINYANKVIGQLSQPWDRLLNEMEAAVDDDVVLLGIEPEAEKGSLLVTAEARSMAAMLAYERRLGQSSVLKNVYVVSHQLQLKDAQKPVRFVVSAGWEPERRAEGALVMSH